MDRTRFEVELEHHHEFDMTIFIVAKTRLSRYRNVTKNCRPPRTLYTFLCVVYMDEVFVVLVMGPDLLEWQFYVNRKSVLVFPTTQNDIHCKLYRGCYVVCTKGDGII